MIFFIGTAFISSIKLTITGQGPDDAMDMAVAFFGFMLIATFVGLPLALVTAIRFKYLPKHLRWLGFSGIPLLLILFLIILF